MSAVWAQAPASTLWTLKDVVSRTQAANRDVASAARGIESAQSDFKSAGVTPPPQLSLLVQSLDFNKMNRHDFLYRSPDAILRLDQTFERGGKKAKREQLARWGILASESDYAQALQTKAIESGLAYWDVKLAQMHLAIAQRHLEMAQESSRVAQLRLRQGDVSKLEASRLMLEAERARNEHDQARLELQQTQIVLSQMLSLAPTAVQAIDAWPEPVAESLLPSEQDWLQQRADIQAADHRIEQARAAVELAQAQRKADITFSMQFERNPSQQANASVGVGVAVPLGMAERQDGPIKKAFVNLAEAEAQLDKLRADALAEWTMQRQTLYSAQSRMQRLDEELVPQAQAALKAAEFARQQGAMSLLEVLDARRVAYSTALEAAQAHADFAKAWTILMIRSMMKKGSL